MTIHHPKVAPQHLARKAVVYLRQSSPRQVQENLQSQRLQYALRDKARGLGFHDIEDRRNFKGHLESVEPWNGVWGCPILPCYVNSAMAFACEAAHKFLTCSRRYPLQDGTFLMR